MLKQRLIVKTRAKARTENVVLWGDYRVTVLGARLFRLEYSERGIFRDGATQAVWYRDMPSQTFTVAENKTSCSIDTGKCKLVLRRAWEKCHVVLEGKVRALDNRGNLLGTYRTLDCCDGDVFYMHWLPEHAPRKIQLGTGVCSKTGVAVLDDSQSLTLGEDGEVKNERAVGKDVYVFAYGDDYRGAVRALYDLTGNVPLVPRFALGNWWSRYHVYTDKEYLRVLSVFEEREIPLSVATVDMDWHWSDDVDKQKHITEQGKNKPEYVGEYAINCGWTGYSWNTELFPNYKAFLKKVRDKGLKITLNLHPSDGVRYWEEQYEKMANAMGVDASTGKQIRFDFTNSKFINAYFDILHRPYEKDGVDFWWIDWQQPNIAWQDGETYDPLWALNHYHYVDNTAGHTTPLILSRYAGVGSHRYPIGFSGDTYITWETLAYLPYFTATATNVGYTWWSHDVGGHHMGDKQDELYLRHLQLGVFSPINRLHCTNFDTMTKEPWLHSNGVQQLAEYFLRLRHELIPYLYTSAYQTATQGSALIEPLYYQWKDAQAYKYTTQYLFGGELLVIPVTQKTHADGFARVKAWLPQGKWTDIFTGDEYEIGAGGRELTLFRTKDSIPVLIPAGGVLPLSKDKGNAYDNPQNLELWVYAGNGEYMLYEDGKEQGKDGVCYTKCVATLQEKDGKCKQTLTLSIDGDTSVIPANRVIAVRFKDIENARLRVFADGKEIKTDEWLTDCVAVKLPFAGVKTYCMQVEFIGQSRLEKIKTRAKKVLTRAEGNNKDKYDTHCLIEKTDSLRAYEEVVENAPLSKVTKCRLKETL